ncbi:LIM and SH3 domain protein Lasp isoform X2 [Plutella xylostella]|uniref:LIM and SH3 domain protein Lasp isoform X2 n=1 Tax=Plutella xylostella TaxID=51655 RepID=UPI0018D04CC3|nr:LIM and SH3 domain protein Lasp isoform X2 [Plutella xylostella]
MNKTCARCEKTVYPTEELKCLDKTWHKGCFKCQECGMTLNMRTYKGYGKLPYCESHVPKAKHTTMAETPELKRIAENTKLQSNVKYHADFERSKGKFTQVADDPETLRIKANTKIISNVAYHGDLEKKAHMERQRQINENGEIVGTHQPIQQQSRSIGRVHDLDPLVDEPPPHNNANSASQRVYVAMYDYEANDSDEVSFREGDLISNVTSIDSGWMTGQVLRTGRTGMLPANYVEVQQH